MIKAREMKLEEICWAMSERCWWRRGGDGRDMGGTEDESRSSRPKRPEYARRDSALTWSGYGSMVGAIVGNMQVRCMRHDTMEKVERGRKGMRATTRGGRG